MRCCCCCGPNGITGAYLRCSGAEDSCVIIPNMPYDLSTRPYWLTEDGWIRGRDGNDLMLWVPERMRFGLGASRTKVKFGGAALGPNWTECWKG